MINIYSICYNRPDLLQYQIKTFRKFLSDEINFWCIDNSNTGNLEHEFRNESLRLNIKHDLVKDKYFGNPGDSHQTACKYVIKQHLSNMTGVSILIDCDIFLIKPLIISDDFGLMGLGQGTETIKYLWPGALFINHNQCTNIEDMDLRGAFIKHDGSNYYIPDTREGFTFDKVPILLQDHYALDSGAMLYFYIKKYQPQVKFISVEIIKHREDTIKYLPENLVGRYNNDYVYWIINGNILHSGVSSNHSGMANEWFINKHLLLKEWLDSIL